MTSLLTNKTGYKPFFSIIILDGKEYYYDKISLAIKYNNSRFHLTPIKKDINHSFFYYDTNIDREITDKVLIDKLTHKYQYKRKLITLINIIDSNIMQNRLKQAFKDYPIGSKTIYKSKYGGFLNLTISDIGIYGDVIKIKDFKHNNTYNIDFCMTQKEIRLHKLKNII